MISSKGGLQARKRWNGEMIWSFTTPVFLSCLVTPLLLCQMVDHGSLPPVLHRSDGKASDSQCIFNMVNAQLVTGLLGFPYCFKTCGLLLTFILMVKPLRKSFAFEPKEAF